MLIVGLIFGVMLVTTGLELCATGIGFIDEGGAPGASIMVVMGLFLFLAPGVMLTVVGLIVSTKFVKTLTPAGSAAENTGSPD